MNIQFSKQAHKIISGAIAVALAGTLTGCAKNTQNEESTSNTSIEKNITSDNDIKSQNTKGSEGLSNAITIDQNSSAVENAITIMIDGAQELAKESDKSKNTEAYKNAKKQVLQDFDDLFNFLFNDKQIAGCTIHDVKDSTVEFAKEKFYELDNYIEKYIPEYKDKAKEKLSKLGNWLEDKGTDALAKGLDYYDSFMDKVETKRKNK